MKIKAMLVILLFIAVLFAPAASTEEAAPMISDERTLSSSKNITAITVLSYPKKVHFGDQFSITGELFIDKDGNGIYSTGDQYIEAETVQAHWQEGSPNGYTVPLVSGINISAGQFSGNFTANEPDIRMNGDSGMELSLRFPGTFMTENGTEVHYLTDFLFDSINRTVLWTDDDNDSYEHQTNGIDDDGDGVIDDGRPEIPPVGDPESVENLTNGVDDDGDGTVDDGSPSIPALGKPEGVDEEIPNLVDDDGDGFIDEDTNGYIVLQPIIKDVYIEVWHYTSIDIDDDAPKIMDIEKDYRLTGSFRDESYPQSYVHFPRVRLFLDNILLHETEVVGFSGDFQFFFDLPVDTEAGPHTIIIRLHPSYNDTTNRYLEPSADSINVKIRRPLLLLFDVNNGTSQTNILRDDIIYINGTVVDRYLYELNGVKRGPLMEIDGVDYTGMYTITLQWAHNMASPTKKVFRNVVINSTGRFSVAFDITDYEMSLGNYNIRCDTDIDNDPYLQPFMYYTNAVNYTLFFIRTTTEMEIWLDQNDNGANDRYDLDYGDDPIDSFITNFEYDPLKDGDSWDTARIRGRVILDEHAVSTDYNILKGNDIDLSLWNGTFNEMNFKVPILDDGMFKIDIPMNGNEKIGPVDVNAELILENDSVFILPTIMNYTRDQFHLVTGSISEIEVSSSLLRGSLRSTNGDGISEAMVDLYLFSNSFTTIPEIEDVEEFGTIWRSVMTDENGAYEIQEWERYIPMGYRTLVAAYNGSEEYPQGPGSERFLPGDAYLSSTSSGISIFRPAPTILSLDTPVEKLIHGEGFSVSGHLKNGISGIGINGGVISIRLEQDDSEYDMGYFITVSRDGEVGSFYFDKLNVPADIGTGPAKLILEFDPSSSMNEGMELIGSKNITDIRIYFKTEFHDGIMLINNSKRSIGEEFTVFWEDIEYLNFSFGLRASDTRWQEDINVTWETVWLKVGMGDQTYRRVLQTNERGRILFNFSGENQLRDHLTGDPFLWDGEGENITITLYTGDGDNFLGTELNLHLRMFSRDTDEVDEEEDHTQLPMMIVGFSALIIIMIFLISMIILIARAIRPSGSDPKEEE